MRRRTTYRITLGATALALAAVAVPGRASSSVAAGWRAPVRVNTDKTKASRETSLVVNPKDPNQAFICDPSGVPAISDNQSYFYRTTNGGKTWKYTTVETATTDTRDYTFEGGDCDVAYDAGGTMWTADTWVGNLSIGHSTNGETWDGTALSTTAPVVDRPWLVGGPAGTLYVTYQDLQCCSPSAMWFTKTTDYGKSFSPAVKITDFASTNGPYTWEGNFVVAPGGKDLYLVFSRRTGGAVSVNSSSEKISLATSHDGGATWTTKDITTIPVETSSIYPSIGMDQGGYLHVAWAAPRAQDSPVFYTMSKDRGATWSATKVLNAGHFGYAPWVAGGKKGQAAIVWLGAPCCGPSSVDAQWFFYVAKVNGSKVTYGATTREPLWEGKQTVPEFEMARYDKYGKLHIGMSVFSSKDNWAVYYQREK